jgi:hypothetical protein
VREAYPFVASRLLTDTSPPLQRALTRLLLREGQLQWAPLDALLDSAATSSDFDLAASAEAFALLLSSEVGEPLQVVTTA